ncbi:DUF1574 family protein [Pedobacter sp. B4-66]|uniref:DUF1574 family protein n=1 Tax=Pedobacter sp. B4-66 TaxID=2817280 RepID=UPI001BDB18CE|nr:DUF1574 family protein [Pedobacter sp. B4-66]
MRQFLKSTFLFLLPILVLGILGEFLLRHIPNDYELKSNYLKLHTSEIAVLFLGSSHAFYGINPANIKEKSFNAAYVSQTLDLDDEILEKYGADWKSLKFIVVPISYFSLYSSMKHNGESWRLKSYEIYCGIKVTDDLFSQFEIFSQFELNMNKLYLYYIKKSTLLTSSYLGWGEHKRVLGKTKFLNSGPVAAKRHTGINEEYFVKNKAVLERIIRFAKQRNIQVLFYTPPAYKTYFEHLDAKQLNQTTHLMADLVAHRNNVTYVNLLKDNSFSISDFHDADHLNRFGAKKLSVMLDGVIQHINPPK